MGEPNWVRVPTMSPSEAVRLLRRRFPELSQLLSDPEDPEPHYSYERFAQEVLQRRGDKVFLSRTYAFINDMASSRDSTLEDLLSVTVLESLAQDQEFAASLYRNINQQAQEALKTVEQRYYGRSRN